MSAITSAGSGNWSSTTPNAPWPSGTVPVDGDTVIIASGHTVTIDQDITIGADSATAAIAVAAGGKLEYLAAAAAAYTLTSKGDLSISGTLELGTVGSPIPSNRGLTVVFTSGTPTDGKYGFLWNNGSTVTIQGAAKTNFVRLNADAAANATSLTADASPSGWLDNDEIVIASTSRTYSETEKGALNGAPVAAALTVDGFAGSGGGILSAHLGSATVNGSMRAEIINLTRNIKVKGNSNEMAYVLIDTTATVDVDNCEFRYLGENATNKRGIEIKTTTGSTNIQNCSLHDCEDWGTYITGGTVNNVVFSGNVAYNCDNQKTGSSFYINGTTNTTITVSGNVWLGCQSINNDRIVNLADVGITFTNNVVAGCQCGTNGSGINLNEGNTIGTFSGNLVHSNQGAGIRNNGDNIKGTILNCTAWRNNVEGFSNHSRTMLLMVDTFRAWGNGSRNLLNQAGGVILRFKDCDFDSDATFTTGQAAFTNGEADLYFFNCDFGQNIAHTAGEDIFAQDTATQRYYIINCRMASANKVTLQDAVGNNKSFARIHRLNQVATSHLSISRWGRIESETSVRHTASGLAWKLSPSKATDKLVFPSFYDLSESNLRVAAASGVAVTLKIWVRKTATYNGNAPRLVVPGLVTQGIATDVVDSLSVAADTWEELSVTVTPTEDGVIEAYVDCDGTAGSVYVDDASQA